MIVRGDFPYTASYVSLFEPIFSGDLTEVVSNFSNRLDTLVTAYTTPAGNDVPGMPNVRGAGYVTAVKSTLETKLRQLYEGYKKYVQPLRRASICSLFLRGLQVFLPSIYSCIYYRAPTIY